MDEQDRDKLGEDTEGHGRVKTIGLPSPRESGEPEEDTEGHGQGIKQPRADGGDDDTEGHGQGIKQPRADGGDEEDVEGHSRQLPR